MNLSNAEIWRLVKLNLSDLSITSWDSGICIQLSRVLFEQGIRGRMDVLHRQLDTHRPSLFGAYWWEFNAEGRQARLDVLDKLIAEAERAEVKS